MEALVETSGLFLLPLFLGYVASTKLGRISL